MSWKLQQLVLDHFPIDGTKLRDVLLALAGHANDDGTECWPSRRRVAFFAGCSSDQARRHIRKLETMDIVSRLPDGMNGGSESQHYRINVSVIEAMPTRLALFKAMRGPLASVPGVPNASVHGVQPQTPCAHTRGTPCMEAPGPHAPMHPNSKDLLRSSDSKKKMRRAASLPALVDPDPDWLPREWKEFEQHRREIKKPLTPTARAQQIKRLARWKAEGHDIAAILRDCTANGYTGLFPPKPNRGNGSRPDRRAGVARSLFGVDHNDDDAAIDGHAERIE